MLSLRTLLTLSLSLSPALALRFARQTNGTSSSSSMPTPGSSDTYSGDITYYETAGGLGACGNTLSDSESICAVSEQFYDLYTQGGNPNDNELCGMKILLTVGSADPITLTIADRCEACAPTDLDLTPDIFQQVVSGGTGVGRTTATWQWA